MSRKLLREFVREVVTEKKRSIDALGAPVWAKYFHLSEKYLGDEFKFTPRLPRAPYEDDHGDVIEDTVTKRVSFAPTIEKALEALPDTWGNFYVYAVSGLPGHVDLEDEFEEKAADLSHPDDNDYGEMWTMQYYKDDYREKFGEPISGLEMKKKLKNLVPDAPKTDEQWATKPVTAKLVGMMTGKSGSKSAFADRVVWGSSKEKLDDLVRT